MDQDFKRFAEKNRKLLRKFEWQRFKLLSLLVLLLFCSFGLVHFLSLIIESDWIYLGFFAAPGIGAFYPVILFDRFRKQVSLQIGTAFIRDYFPEFIPDTGANSDKICKEFANHAGRAILDKENVYFFSNNSAGEINDSHFLKMPMVCWLDLGVERTGISPTVNRNKDAMRGKDGVLLVVPMSAFNDSPDNGKRFEQLMSLLPESSYKAGFFDSERIYLFYKCVLFLRPAWLKSMLGQGIYRTWYMNVKNVVTLFQAVHFKQAL
ncbi:MAG: hypothetical protein JNL74_23745 [Fibrobacteres bacterium]|nr:hypothetical protein [Fibrobacterota bacterium]